MVAAVRQLPPVLVWRARSVCTPSGSIFTWADQPFDWNTPDFLGVNFSMDFQTDGNGPYDDDRIGWMIHNDSTSSDDIFGVQLDPGGGGRNIECYWDGAPSDDEGRTSIATLPELNPDGWYRLQANITRLTSTSAQIDVYIDASWMAAGTRLGSGVRDHCGHGPASRHGRKRDPQPGLLHRYLIYIYPAFKNHLGTARCRGQCVLRSDHQRACLPSRVAYERLWVRGGPDTVRWLNSSTPTCLLLRFGIRWGLRSPSQTDGDHRRPGSRIPLVLRQRQ